MSSDQVNREINAIDSVLKALSTGGYSTTSVATLSEVAVTVSRFNFPMNPMYSVL